MSSLVDYIKDQEILEKKARELMPYDSNKCTFELGSIRQDLFACLTCFEKSKKLNAVCYACSINCHTNHNLIELFSKRSFTCDCGTSRVNNYCIVRYPNIKNLIDNDNNKLDFDIPNSNNKYNHNFKGLFCDCNDFYNPNLNSNMFQCILGLHCLEDWYHDECIMGLKPGIINRDPELIKKENIGKEGEETKDDEEEEEEDDDENDDEFDILPLPGFPDLDSFETIICWKCASQFPTEMKELVENLNCDTIKHINSKSFDDRILKISNNNSTKRIKKSIDYPITIFLKKNFKNDLKKLISKNPDSNLSIFLKKHPFMYLDDPIYKPPIDNDDSSSVLELGLRELNNLPNNKVIEGLIAYENIKSKLKNFLKPFAEQNKIVTEDEIKNFFNSESKK